MFYTVLEIQEDNAGNRACVPPVIYSDYNEALAKLYTILAAAAKSGIPYHAGCILRSDNIVTDGRAFNRKPEGE